MKPKNLKTLDMEIALMGYFDIRRKLVVPNISWGFFRHECDLVSISEAGYATEIEIKISKSDLKKDAEKKHGHFDSRISYLIFAIPDYMEDCIDLIPERAGIILVDKNLRCRTLRRPKQNNKYKFSLEEMYKIARLGAMRILGLKIKIRNYRNKAVK